MHHVGQEGLHRIVVRVEVDVGQIRDGPREGVRAGSREHNTGSVGEFLAIGEDPRTFFEKTLPGVVVLELWGDLPRGHDLLSDPAEVMATGKIPPKFKD